jgi:hypothetical protein
MIHHRRGHAGAIETRVLREGMVVLDPPGFEAQVAAIFSQSNEGARRPPESKARRISRRALFGSAPRSGRAVVRR